MEDEHGMCIQKVTLMIVHENQTRGLSVIFTVRFNRQQHKHTHGDFQFNAATTFNTVPFFSFQTARYN